MMLNAGTLEFTKQYPHGALVHDRLGRKLDHVFGCDPLTGEVIMYDFRPVFWNRILNGSIRLRRWDYWRWHIRSGLPTRHGFWPAPLTITPIQPM